MKKYIDSKSMIKELDRLIDKEIKNCKKHASFLEIYGLKAFKKNVSERLDIAESAYDEIFARMHTANEEGREHDAEIYGECSEILAQLLGIECFLAENGELVRKW